MGRLRIWLSQSKISGAALFPLKPRMGRMNRVVMPELPVLIFLFFVLTGNPPPSTISLPDRRKMRIFKFFKTLRAVCVSSQSREFSISDLPVASDPKISALIVSDFELGIAHLPLNFSVLVIMYFIYITKQGASCPRSLVVSNFIRDYRLVYLTTKKSPGAGSVKNP